MQLAHLANHQGMLAKLAEILAQIEGHAWPRSTTWQHLRVAQDLETASADYRAAERAVKEAEAQVRDRRNQLRTARQSLYEAVIAAYRDGTRVRDLVAVTGLSREWIRQLLRNAGIEAD